MKTGSVMVYEMIWGLITDIPFIMRIFDKESRSIATKMTLCEVGCSIRPRDGGLVSGRIRWRQGYMDAKYLISCTKLHAGVSYKHSCQFVHSEDYVPPHVPDAMKDTNTESNNDSIISSQTAVSLYSRVIVETTYVLALH